MCVVVVCVVRLRRATIVDVLGICSFWRGLGGKSAEVMRRKGMRKVVWSSAFFLGFRPGVARCGQSAEGEFGRGPERGEGSCFL